MSSSALCNLAAPRSSAASLALASQMTRLPPSLSSPRSASLSSGRKVTTSVRAEAESKTAESAPATSEIKAPADFVPPEPRKFYVAPDQLLDFITAALPFAFRFGTGAFTTSYTAKVEPSGTAGANEYVVGPVLGRELYEQSSFTRRPEQPIILYEFEGCPFCRKVREAVSALDIDVLYYPTPQGGPRFRPEAIAKGGKKQFPYMEDPNSGVSLYESDDIIKYLADTYGNGSVPLMLRLGTFTNLTAGFAQLGRIAKGSRYTPAKQPEKPLELWAYEPSPWCKLVREVLVELELPHIYHSTPRGSAKRKELIEKTGRFQVPYLEDPNTGVKTFESKAIIDYLRRTYELPATA